MPSDSVSRDYVLSAFALVLLCNSLTSVTNISDQNQLKERRRVYSDSHFEGAMPASWREYENHKKKDIVMSAGGWLVIHTHSQEADSKQKTELSYKPQGLFVSSDTHLPRRLHLLRSTVFPNVTTS